MELSAVHFTRCINKSAVNPVYFYAHLPRVLPTQKLAMGKCRSAKCLSLGYFDYSPDTEIEDRKSLQKKIKSRKLPNLPTSLLMCFRTNPMQSEPLLQNFRASSQLTSLHCRCFTQKQKMQVMLHFFHTKSCW